MSALPQKPPALTAASTALGPQAARRVAWIGFTLAAVGTAVFLFLAFLGAGAGPDRDWPQLAGGDLAVKAAMAALLLAPYRALLPRLQTWAAPQSTLAS